jgi:Ni,Fe-hydrogenase I large subunit
MSITFNLDPIPRIEGHLKILVRVDQSGDPNPGQVSNVQCESKLFRGWENILKTRDTRDAPVICQRI